LILSKWKMDKPQYCTLQLSEPILIFVPRLSVIYPGRMLRLLDTNSSMEKPIKL